jgi:hypothetical protein
MSKHISIFGILKLNCLGVVIDENDDGNGSNKKSLSKKRGVNDMLVNYIFYFFK